MLEFDRAGRIVHYFSQDVDTDTPYVRVWTHRENVEIREDVFTRLSARRFEFERFLDLEPPRLTPLAPLPRERRAVLEPDLEFFRGELGL